MTKGGYGDGTITTATPGLTCTPFDCTLQSTQSPSVTLTAAARASSTFKGWSGGCTGTDACVVTLDASKTVTATFDWVSTGTDPWHAHNAARQAVDVSSYVAFDSSAAGAGAFPLFAGGAAAPLVVNAAADGEYAGVVRAVGDLASDVERVTAHQPTVANATAGAGTVVVLIGTIGHSKIIDALVGAGKLDEARGLDGKWETWVTKVVAAPMTGVDQALVIAGSDQRGTIYGVYDLSRNIGVSPWYFWDDVKPVQQAALYVKADKVHTLGTPAVKYRGFFINDEAPALTTWWSNYGHTGTFNAELYGRMFELALRLRANVVWPAVWGKAFDLDDVNNHRTAQRYGMVIGMSHEAPMDRGIEEWNRQFSKYGGKDPSADWNYLTNPTGIRAYWKDGVDRMAANGFEDIVTVGQRGNGDKANAVTSLPFPRSLPLVQQIMGDERRILADATREQPDQTPQNWILYSEVQNYWDQGVRPPSDVTVTFCDDNYGNIRDLPSLPAEERSGGYGIYYHVDFVGPPRSYMWVDTNHIANIWEQMQLAYARGVDRLWVVNSGDVKGNERPTQFFLDLAWSPENWKDVQKLTQWQAGYAAQSFGPDHAQAIAAVLHAYERLQSRRKPELLNASTPNTTTLTSTGALDLSHPGDPNSAGSTFSLVNYREMERVVKEWEALRAEAESVKDSLPAAQQDAYFELVLYAIQGTENAYQLRLAQFQNLLYAQQGRTVTTDLSTAAADRLQDDKDLQAAYDAIAGGTWKGFQSQAKFAYVDWSNLGASDAIKPVLATALTAKTGQDWGFAISGSSAWWGKGQPSIYRTSNAKTDSAGVAASADAPKLPQQSRFQTAPAPYLEVFNRGTGAVSYAITSDDTAAVTVTNASGTLDGTTKAVRAEVHVNWANVTASKAVKLTVTGGDGWTKDVLLPLDVPGTEPAADRFVEAGGYVSIEAMNASRVVNKDPITWLLIPDLGKTASAYTPYPQNADPQTPTAGGDTPRLEYDVQLYDEGHPLTVWVHASPRNNVLPNRGTADGGIRYAVSIDDDSPTTVNITKQTGAADDRLTPGNVFFYLQGWQRNAADNAAPSYSTHTLTTKGAGGRHTLKIWMVDPTVIIQKIIIDTSGVPLSPVGPQSSYLGPPESCIYSSTLHACSNLAP